MKLIINTSVNFSFLFFNPKKFELEDVILILIII